MQRENRLLLLSECHYTRDAKGALWANTMCDTAFFDRFFNVFSTVILAGRYSDAIEDPKRNGYVRADHPGVQLVELPDFRGPRGMVRNARSVRRIVRSLAAKADAILFRVPSPIASVAYGAVKGTGVPFGVEVVVNPETAFLSGNHPSLPSKVMAELVSKQTRHMVKTANGAAYVTSAALQKRFPSRSINDGPSERYFDASYTTASLKADTYRRPKNASLPLPLRIACVGSMGDARKRQDIVLATVAGLRNRGIETEAVLIGDGALRSEYEHTAAALGIHDCVQFTGQLPGPQAVRSVVGEASLLMCPSTAEGLPRCMLEAMASGVLAVGSGVDGMAELIDDSCIAHHNTPDEYISIIERFLSSPETYAATVNEQYAVAQNFEDEKVQAKRDAFYRRLINVPRCGQ